MQNCESISLQKMSDNEILVGLHSLRSDEKNTVANILKYLREVDRRSVHLKRGFDSLYTFCQEELGYSKDEAYFRIQAMEVLKILPETEEKLKAGSLSLTTVAKAQIAFKKENRRRRAENEMPLSKEEKSQTLEVLSSHTSRDAEAELAARFPQIQNDVERTKPISESRTLIQFAAEEKQMNKFKTLKGYLRTRILKVVGKNFLTGFRISHSKFLTQKRMARRMQRLVRKISLRNENRTENIFLCM